MRTLTRIGLALLLCAYARPLAAAEPPRYSGTGVLLPAAARTADGRLAIDAELRPSTDVSATGRFVLDARLRAPQLGKAATAAICDGLFANGFEG